MKLQHMNTIFLSSTFILLCYKKKKERIKCLSNSISKPTINQNNNPIRT